MYNESYGITVSRHIMDSQRLHPEATGDLSGLLSELIVAAKVISREVNKAGLADILGATGIINIQDEQVQKLDAFSDQIIIERMQHIGQLCCMSSEEDADLIEIPSQYPKGNYIIVFDPLDGSSNIDVNVSIGTIFGIYKKKSAETDIDLLMDDVLQPGQSGKCTISRRGGGNRRDHADATRCHSVEHHHRAQYRARRAAGVYRSSAATASAHQSLYQRP